MRWRGGELRSRRRGEARSTLSSLSHTAGPVGEVRGGKRVRLSRRADMPHFGYSGRRPRGSSPSRTLPWALTVEVCV